MSTAWVAGNVRAKAMLDRRIGPARARDLAATGSLAQAVQILADSPYGHGVHVGQTLAEAEHALAATVLWHVRVLAGWQPRPGARALRLLVGWFEIANIIGHARAVSGAAVEPSFHLGALGTAWSRLRTTSSLAELRRGLTQSLWGDPGGESPSDIAVGVALTWACRVATGVPEASDWACGGAAVLVARRLLLEGRPLAQPAQAKRGANPWTGVDGRPEPSGVQRPTTRVRPLGFGRGGRYRRALAGRVPMVVAGRAGRIRACAPYPLRSRPDHRRGCGARRGCVAMPRRARDRGRRWRIYGGLRCRGLRRWRRCGCSG